MSPKLDDLSLLQFSTPSALLCDPNLDAILMLNAMSLLLHLLFSLLTTLTLGSSPLRKMEGKKPKSRCPHLAFKKVVGQLHVSSYDSARDARPEITFIYRIDPAWNMARFYYHSIELALFGGSSLVRNWGTIGMSGWQLIKLFDRPEMAAAACQRMALYKLNHSYYQHKHTACAAQEI